MLFDPCDVKEPGLKAGENEKLETPDKRIDPHCHRSTPKRRRRLTANQIKMDTIDRLVGKITPGEVLHMVGANHWNSQHLIDAMQAQIGAPCELWISVYSVSAPAVVRMNQMTDAGRLVGVHAVINHHMARSRADVTAHLSQICTTLSIYPVHAKVYILRSPKHGISIYSSANLTGCAWVESAVITEGADFADWNIGWITQSMNLAEPFSGGNMSKSVRADVLEGKKRWQK
jgi:hypothetical protein